MDTTIRLTSRETDVLYLLAHGCTYSQVSDWLGVSLHTVRATSRTLTASWTSIPRPLR